MLSKAPVLERVFFFFNHTLDYMIALDFERLNLEVECTVCTRWKMVIITSERWERCSTGAVPRPALSLTVLTRWHRANMTDYFGLCEQDGQAWTVVCMCMGGGGALAFYRVQHICIAPDKTLSESVALRIHWCSTHNWATDSLILTVHVLHCCYHHDTLDYTTTAALQRGGPSGDIPGIFLDANNRLTTLPGCFNTVQTARGDFQVQLNANQHQTMMKGDSV